MKLNINGGSEREQLLNYVLDTQNVGVDMIIS
jgi:hypothetical protein